MEGHTTGKVVIATVFRDVHDIGKSLVNTILTNNGYAVIDLREQVPVDVILDAQWNMTPTQSVCPPYRPRLRSRCRP